ncbi:MAG: CAP domain-containing protein [Dokdonella sp.]
MKFQRVGLRHALLLLALLSAPAYAVYPDFIFIAGADSWEVSAPPEWRPNLMAHNAARNQVVPAATTPIPPLTWSTSIAATAQAYSAQCIWAHSGAAGLGENLAAAAPWSDQRLASAMNWASENVNYNYAANSCPTGQQCGHYTQMVWAATSELGCGTTNCSTGSPFPAGFEQWTSTVCNYTPPGNNGQRPY